MDILQVRFLLTLVIIQKSEMGQNARAVQQVVVNLENQKLISPEQAEQFIKDYQNKSPRIDEVHKFIEQPDLTYFLKYYIGAKYNSHIKQEKKTKQQWGSSRSSIEEEVLEMAEIQMKNQVIDMIKSEQKRIVRSIKQCCEVVIQQNYNLFKCMIKKLLKQNMEIQQFQIVVKNNEQILIYESDIDQISFIHPECLQWNSLTKQFSLSHKNRYEYDQGKDQFIFYFHQQISKYAIRFRVTSNINHSLYQSLLANQSIRQKIIKVLVKLLEYFDYHSPYLSMLTKFCLHAFEIIQIGAYIMQEKIKNLIGCLMGTFSQQQKDQVNIIDFIKKSVNDHRNVNRKEIIGSIEKKYKNVSRQLKVIDSYTQMIQNQQFFLDFDKYSELRFCFIPKYHTYEDKLKNCWGQDRIKVIDIMCEHADLLSKLVEVGKNQQKPGVIQQSSSSYTSSIFIGENGLLERVMILFDKKKQNNKKKVLSLSQDCPEESNLKQKENNKSTSKMQQKIVKDLQKQDPNIRKTGWLKLFVKEATSFEPVFNQKEQSKLSVTDIQKIDGIDNQLNVLDLSEKQLLVSVWSIMKTNPLFSLLVKDEQTEVKFTSFLNELNYHYSVNNNKFHNFYHAINVLHMCSILSKSQKVENTLTKVQMFSILMSGLCHDVGHTGFSNSYEIVSFSQKAITYNDNSPLQNFQASKTIQILKNNQNNFLQKMERDKYIQFKQNLIHNILSTDLNQHFIVLDKFKEWLKLPKEQAKTQCSALTAMIVHTSDYAGACKEFSIAQQWSHRLNLEFMNQEESERKLGIKNTQSGMNYIGNALSNNEISFLQVIVLPLYEEIGNFQADNTFLYELIEQVKKNKNEWQGLSKKQ